MSVIYDAPRVQYSPLAAPVFPPATSPTPPRRRAHPVRWLAAGVAAVLLCGIAALAVAAQSSADPQLAAIQQVIQRGNDEQVQAISSQNPAVMSDTATPAHYQQLVQVNQNLLGQGVASIRLTNLTWGPITIDGTTATATSYETWVTTFADSTTMSSTDTNVYTLVQQNGSWVIQDDQQPTATPTASQPSTSPAAPGLPGQPSASAPAPQAVAPGAQNTSHNWSGYAATNGQPYTAVTGTWTVPQLASGGAQGVGATWVGIGGVTSRDLIQAGTQDVASGSGQSQYQAWIETLPQASRQVPLAVAPGDSVTVSIVEQGAGSGVWQIAFKNNTSGQTYQTTVNYTSSNSSAEWVEEAPASPNGIVPLDNFGTVGFSAASAVQNGQTVNLSQAGAQPITMLNSNSQPLAVPSAIGSDGSSFSVARTSATATPAASPGRRPAAPRN